MGGLFSKPKAPAPLPAPPPPAPPVSQVAEDVVTASRDEKRKLAKRKGIESTVLGGSGLAGGTGYSSNAGLKTKLGEG